MGQTSDQLYERMLVVRCQAGDAAAFEELVARYQPRLSYFVRKLLADWDGAEDLLQEVWLDVFRSVPRLTDPAAFAAWIYRIARDRAYRELRRRHVKLLPIESADEVEQQSPPEEDLSEEDVRLVHACLSELAPGHREVLVLRFVGSMSYEDIAQVAACNVGTVRSRLHYAKQALRRAIERKRQ